MGKSFSKPLVSLTRSFVIGVPLVLDADKDVPTPISFWLSGAQYHLADGELVCPAWMIPPTDVAYPTLVLGHTKPDEASEFIFEGHRVWFAKHYLQFNQHEDTPVVVKKIDDRVYAVLVREHLTLVGRMSAHNSTA